MLLKYINSQLLFAVNHIRSWTMASERADPIDWTLPSTLLGSTPRVAHAQWMAMSRTLCHDIVTMCLT